jgi:NTP pyrophosphatase (non-canonical NTP hydrolase)
MSDDKIFDDAAVRSAGCELQRACHAASVAGGWWTDLETGSDHAKAVRSGSPFGRALVGVKLCLIHSEVSEAMEGHRKGLMDDKLPHRQMIEVELADAVIRIADLAGALGLDLGGAIAEKMAFNAVRPDHKPEARAAEGGKAF